MSTTESSDTATAESSVTPTKDQKQDQKATQLEPPKDVKYQKILERLKDRHRIFLHAHRISELELPDDSAASLTDTQSSIQPPTSPLDKSKRSRILRRPTLIKIPEESSSLTVAQATRYRLASCDVFVEKAQFFLEERAGHYFWLGFVLYAFSLLALGFGTWLAETRLVTLNSNPPKDVVPLIANFIVAFTAFGMIVLVAVFCVRGAKACLDQRERLLTKRHALRQGRLFLHLAGGRADAEQMERAFNWNTSQANAFTDMKTDAKAPWGSAIDEIIKTFPELLKAAMASSSKTPSKETPG